MPVKKLSWFRKRLANFGKRIYYWKSQKVNLLAVNIMIQEVLQNYIEINGGDVKKAFTIFEEHIHKGASDIISEMVLTPIVLGVSLSSMYSKTLEDIAFITALYVFALLGSDSAIIFDEPIFETDGAGGGYLRIKMNHCMACAGESKITADDLGEKSYGKFIAEIFEASNETMTEYVEENYAITSSETKCLLRGDDYGEITVHFRRID